LFSPFLFFCLICLVCLLVVAITYTSNLIFPFKLLHLFISYKHQTKFIIIKIKIKNSFLIILFSLSLFPFRLSFRKQRKIIFGKVTQHRGRQHKIRIDPMLTGPRYLPTMSCWYSHHRREEESHLK
jgi:hypothetical protein